MQFFNVRKIFLAAMLFVGSAVSAFGAAASDRAAPAKQEAYDFTVISVPKDATHPRPNEGSKVVFLVNRVQGRTLVARLEGHDDRDAAAALRGTSVAVPRAALPRTQSGEYYWADLIGLAVVNGSAQGLGRITGVLQTGANDVLVVAGERERLIPFIAEVIRDVDLAAGVLRVEWGADY